MASLSEYLLYCVRVGIFPEWHKILFRRKMGSKKLSGLQNVRNFATTWVETKVARFQSEKDWTSPNATTDIITRLLRVHDNDPGKISKAEILTAGIMNVGAGSDTTSIAFSAAIFNLLKHPSSLRRLQEEIREYEARGVISDPIKFSEAQKMPYLQAVIKEALRVHPATGLILGRVVPKEGAVLAGQYFPPGVRLLT